MIVSECLVFVVIGPDLFTTDIVQFVSDVKGNSLFDVIDPQKVIYWQMLYLCLGLMGATVGFAVFFRYALGRVFPSHGFLVFGKEFCDIATPVVANILYIPILHYTSEIFRCVETTGDDLSEQFLTRDCEVTCWQPMHGFHAAISAIGILLYVPFSLHLRLIW
jgi:hypothetical protein